MSSSLRSLKRCQAGRHDLENNDGGCRVCRNRRMRWGKPLRDLLYGLNVPDDEFDVYAAGVLYGPVSEHTKDT